MKKHISYSELKTWYECAYKHKLSYIDEVKKFVGNEHTAFGTAVHEVCEKSVLKEIPNDEISLKNCFNNKFLEELKYLTEKNVTLNKKLIKDIRGQVDDLLVHILPSLNKKFGNYEVVSAEEQLYEPIDDSEKKYKGFIDLVIKTPDGRYHIIDWKTCSWGWNAEKRSDRLITYQLTLYKKFFCQKHNIDPSMVETHFALLKRTAKDKNVEIFRVTSGSKKTSNATKLMTDALHNLHSGMPIKNRSNCNNCEFRNTQHCP